MYFKHLVKRVAKEIIELEKKSCEKNNWSLSFSLETLIQHEEIVLKVKEAKNYSKIYEIDVDDYVKNYGEDDREYFDLWIISDHVLEYIEDQGYEIV